MSRIGIYPGSFDPITNGHLDIINRASKLFDEVIILVAQNKSKVSRFSVNERVEMIKEAIKGYKNVKVDSYEGITVEYAKAKGAIALIRGIRVVSDFEYEWQLAAANEYIDRDIEMVFLMSHRANTFISSSTIDELYFSGVDITPLVPKIVLDFYKKKNK
ncbi:MAG: pantetheine-phosphate adenylyltransferase [Firmicutes bacterium]|uniref:Phosphopantetheine adenylyltransferase n=1 Tax=Candidatus Onthovivens merdipullorum TaxID=2840889 RepID=A0A9D9GWY3_9BACL|nr:pantetheine-phosphate adenylyltransferase [Candidatus Onthovivens merdipullorum]